MTAIVLCEVGFWVVLAAGLLARYALGRRRTGAVLLLCVPLVDLVLLAVTVTDLHGGAPARFTHGLAAVYLGFSVAFGHAMVRWADVRVAHRFAGGPAPEPKPGSGTWARARREWREFGQACLAAGISAALLAAAVALIGGRTDTSELQVWFPWLGTMLLVWAVGWPVWETARAAATNDTR